MAKGSSKATATKKILCMGCGKYFAKRHVEFIEGVPFCSDCKSAGSEFRETLKAERDAMLETQGLPTSEESKWEQAWSSKEMVNITPEKLERLPHPIPLNGIQATLSSRMFGHFLDFVFVGFALMVIDMFVPLSQVTSLMFGNLGLEIAEYDYSNLLDPLGREILLTHTEVLRKVALFAFLFLGLYRILFFLLFRRTLGQAFAKVMYTDPRGHYPGVASRLTKAITSSLSDAALVGPVIEAIVYSVSRPQTSLSDAMANMRAVRYDRWKGVAADILHRTSMTRLGDSPTQESYSSRNY